MRRILERRPHLQTSDRLEVSYLRRWTMKITIAAIFLIAQCAAFAPAIRSPRSSVLQASTQTKKKEGGVAEELGTPCDGDCALESYPKLPPSVHPGVLSGKAMMDLLNHAKENGE